jgi:hypothetical protein
MTQQARGKDARIVDDEGIAGSQTRREIGNRAMFERPSAAIERQQAGLTARRRRLGDQVLWQREVEVGYQHWPCRRHDSC